MSASIIKIEGEMMLVIVLIIGLLIIIVIQLAVVISKFPPRDYVAEALERDRKAKEQAK